MSETRESDESIRKLVNLQFARSRDCQSGLAGHLQRVLLHSGGFRGPARDFITAVAYLVLVALTFVVGTLHSPRRRSQTPGLISIIIASTIWGLHA
jgi:hypothetical protein